MEFTYSGYVAMLNELRQQGYAFANYENYSQYSRCVILRHDVDYSLEKALALAGLEKKESVTSTYMILVSSGFYNLMDCETQNILHQILNMGHHLGLHFDESNYEITNINLLKNKIKEEMKMLRKCTGHEEISVVSMHRPSRQCLEADIDFTEEGMINSYGKTFFLDFKYVSDSRMLWREPVMDYIHKAEYERMHILTHAFWYSREQEDIKVKMERFLNQAWEDRYRLLNQNFRDLQEYILYDSRDSST